MHDFIPEQRYEERRRRDDDDARVPGDGGVDGVDQLRADDDVHGRPADAGEAVEEGDDLDAVVAEEEAREDHLAQAEDGAEGAVEADGHDAEEVDEEDC